MTRYVGSVTDENWIRAILRLNPTERKPHINAMMENKVHDNAFDFIFGLKRMPRVFIDEYKQGE